jgi:hypothetical protein
MMHLLALKSKQGLLGLQSMERSIGGDRRMWSQNDICLRRLIMVQLAISIMRMLLPDVHVY